MSQISNVLKSKARKDCKMSALRQKANITTILTVFAGTDLKNIKSFSCMPERLISSVFWSKQFDGTGVKRDFLTAVSIKS